jgi:hypothetical protein
MERKDPQSEVEEKAPESEDEPTYTEDGVDVTLIRWMLSLSPTERLQVLQESVQSLIRTKEELGRDKDRAVIPILRRTLEEKSKM